MNSYLRAAIGACLVILLSACNLPYAAQPTPTGPALEASVTPFALETQPGAPTATSPAINIITATPAAPPTPPPASTLPPPTAAPPTANSTPAVAYPDTPEGVIQAFVEAYPDDTSGMLQFLSASLRASLPAGGPGELLNVQGDINGMLILSGSSIPNPPQAVFQVALQLGTEQALRTFSLGQETGRWVITGIQ